MGAGCSSVYTLSLLSNHHNNNSSPTQAEDQLSINNDNTLSNSPKFHFGKKNTTNNVHNSLTVDEIANLEMRATSEMKKVTSFRIPSLRVSFIGFNSAQQVKSQEELNLEFSCSYLPQHLLYCLRFTYYGGEGKLYKKKLATPLPESTPTNEFNNGGASEVSSYLSVSTGYSTLSSHNQDHHSKSNHATMFKRSASTTSKKTRIKSTSAALMEEERIKIIDPLCEFVNETCVLLIEMKGFSRVVDAFYEKSSCQLEEISRYIYYVYTSLIAVIHDLGGDIERFEGDCILCQFFSPRMDRTFTDSILSAIKCALRIQSMVNIKSYKSETEHITLEVKCLVGVGDCVSYHLGGYGKQWIRLFGGDVVLQVREKLRECQEGLVFITKETFDRCKQFIKYTTDQTVSGLYQALFVVREVQNHPLASLTFHCSFSSAILLFLNKQLLNSIETKSLISINQVLNLTICTLAIRTSQFGSSFSENDLHIKNKIVRNVQEITEQYNSTFHELFFDKEYMYFVFTFEKHLAEENPSLVIQCAREVVGRDNLHFTGMGFATGYCFRASVGSDFRRDYGIYGELVKNSIAYCNYANKNSKSSGMIVCDPNTATILEDVCTIKPLGTCHLDGTKNQKLHSILMDTASLTQVETCFMPKPERGFELKRASEGNIYLNLDSRHYTKITQMVDTMR